MSYMRYTVFPGWGTVSATTIPETDAIPAIPVPATSVPTATISAADAVPAASTGTDAISAEPNAVYKTGTDA